MKTKKLLLSLLTLGLMLTGCKTKKSEEPSVTSEPPVTTTSEVPTTSEDPVTTSDDPVTTSDPTPTTSEEEPTTEDPVITDFIITGSVKDKDGVAIADAVVMLGKDNRQADFSGVDGKFTFEKEEVTADLTLIVTHGEHLGKEIQISKEDAVNDTITVDVVLEKAVFIDLGPDTTFGGKFGLNASYEVGYGEDAIVVRNHARGGAEWSDSHKVEIYIDTKGAAAGRDHTTFSIQPWGKLDYSDDMIVSYAEGRPALADTFGFTKYFDSKLFVTTIPYALLSSDDVAPVKGDTFGFSIGVWNSAAADWDGWGWWSSPATDAQIAYNVEYGGNFIAPEHANRYVHLLGDGTITFTKQDGELWVFVPPTESNLADLDLTSLTYHSLLAPFGGLQVPGGVIAHVSRSSDIALAVKFVTTQESFEPYTIEFFLDTGFAGADRVDGSTWRFNVFGNGNVAAITSFGGTAFGNEETKTTVDGSNLYFAVTYEAINISNTEQYGVTFGALAGGWDGWGIDGSALPFAADYVAEHGGFVAPETPYKYIRVLSNGALTWTKADGSLVSRDTLVDGYRVLEGKFGQKFFAAGIEIKVRHGADGVEFVFTAPEELTASHKIELFIDTGLANAGQDATTRRIDLWANSDPVEGVIKEHVGAVLSANVLYETLGINKGDQIGFAVGIWSQTAGDWDGFGFGSFQYAAEYEAEYGATFIAPEHANRYIRLLPDNSLTFTRADLSFYL